MKLHLIAALLGVTALGGIANAVQSPTKPPAAGKADSDGDGRIGRAEFDVQSAKRFQRLDTNGDGTIDKQEMAAVARGGRGLARMDADGNGALTRAEYDSRAATRFQRMDANGDGFIDASERGAMGQRGRRGAQPVPQGSPAPKTPGG